MTSTDPLIAIADALYAGPITGFTAARDAVAKAESDKALSKRVRGLRKPSVAAWAVNLLVRREAGQIDEVLGVAEALREAAASMDGDELRTLTRQRRQLTIALTTRARALVREYGARLTEPVADQVEGVLTAAMLDPVAADVVRTGLVVTSFTSTGVSELDVALVLAVPDAAGARATPTGPEPVALHVVPEDDALRRERAKEALAEAMRALAEAEVEAAGLQRRIAELEAEAARVDAELSETERDRAGAEATLTAAHRKVDKCKRALQSAQPLARSTASSQRR